MIRILKSKGTTTLLSSIHYLGDIWTEILNRSYFFRVGEIAVVKVHAAQV